MAVELNDTTNWPEGRGHCPCGAPLDADLTDCCCEHGAGSAGGHSRLISPAYNRRTP